MRGRYPAGPESVEQLQGSDKAKERVRVILETIQGSLRVQEACDRLGISEQRHRQLRAQMLQAAVARVEDQPSGRPARAPESAEVVALRQQVAQLQRELQAARVYEEIALALPQVGRTLPPGEVKPVAAPPAPPAGAAPPFKKKRRSRPCRNRR
jgi:transposase-like protein